MSVPISVGRCIVGVGLMVLFGASAGRAAIAGGEAVVVRATEPPSLAVMVGTERLAVGVPEIRMGEVKAKAPRDYAESYENWDPWPAGPKTDGGNYIAPSPRNDETGTLILGGLFRSIDPESVLVKNGDGSKTFKPDEDYKLNPRWGMVANLSGRLGKPGESDLVITLKYATQRLDLVEMDGAGKLSVKPGKSSMVCPVLPTADAGHKAVAGIWLVPWKQAGEYAVTAENIFPIEPVPEVAPIHPEALAQTRKKLGEGKQVKIAFLGDSVTLGAESGAWWDGLWTPKNLGYPSRFVVGLQARYPKATVTPIAAFKGGIAAKAAGEMLDKTVLPEKPDLVVIAFGLNDAAGPVKGPATNPPEKFRADILNLIKKAEAAGSEVLLIAPFPGSPFLKNAMAQRIPDYRKILVDLAAQENAACADVYTEWMNQAKKGVPPESQVHNWINHPGAQGHALYADVLLRFFDDKP